LKSREIVLGTGDDETVVSTGQFVKSISRVIRKNIKNEKLAQALEFPVPFLGAKPSKTPAFYSIMNYADLVLGPGIQKAASSVWSMFPESARRIGWKDSNRINRRKDSGRKPESRRHSGEWRTNPG
jgi:hypothetical protein